MTYFVGENSKTFDNLIKEAAKNTKKSKAYDKTDLSLVQR